jgi:murein DD-endopeptidase MepM/ murein hydrolase activator NlpD
MRRFVFIGTILVLGSSLLLHAQNHKRTVYKIFNNESIDRFTPKCMPNICAKRCFAWPVDVDKFWVSSLYGKRKRPNGSQGWHHGIDMAAFKGEKVYAIAKGTITFAGSRKGYGNSVDIEHQDKSFISRYAHLDTIAHGVYEGVFVRKGQYLGSVGATGNVRALGNDPSHLHFEIYHQDERIDPLCCLAQSPCT